MDINTDNKNNSNIDFINEEKISNSESIEVNSKNDNNKNILNIDNIIKEKGNLHLYLFDIDKKYELKSY